MVRETKWGDVKVTEEVDCVVEVVVTPQHISTAIKQIGEGSIPSNCLDSELQHFAMRRQHWRFNFSSC